MSAASKAGLPVRAWQSEDGAAVVWGTHWPGQAWEHYRRFLVEECGLDAEEAVEGQPTALDWVVARAKWGHPGLPNDEHWSEDRISRKPVDGWVPFLTVAL